MTIPVTELSSSFDQWRVNTNQNSTDIGDTTTLQTVATNLTSAINENRIDKIELMDAVNRVGEDAVSMAIALGG